MIPLKVISLERSTQRRAEFRRLNAHLDHEFFNAVDGAALSLADVKATGLFETGLPYTVGAYGLALSHLALWDQVIASGQPLTVAEDDAIFRRDFAATHASLLERAPADWDLVLWGWNFDSVLVMDSMPEMPTVMLFSQEKLRQTVPAFQALADPPRLFPLRRAFGGPAYTISPAGARKFKAQCFPVTNFSLEFPRFAHKVPNTGIDVVMNRVYAAATSLVSFPPLAVTKNDRAASTIQNGAPLR